jgi:hypothetical protein
MTLGALTLLRPAAAQVKYNLTTLPLVSGANAARPTAINNPLYDAAGKLLRPAQVVGGTPSSNSKVIKGWVYTSATPPRRPISSARPPAGFPP